MKKVELKTFQGWYKLSCLSQVKCIDLTSQRNNWGKEKQMLNCLLTDYHNHIEECKHGQELKLHLPDLENTR